MTKQRVTGRISTNRDLFVRSSFSWYHSNLGAGTAMNWQWNLASSFLNTSTSWGEITGRGKLLSAKEKKKKRRTNICVITRANHQTIKFHMCGCSAITKGAMVGFIKPARGREKLWKRENSINGECQQLRWALKSLNRVNMDGYKKKRKKKAEWLFMINLKAQSTSSIDTQMAGSSWAPPAHQCPPPGSALGHLRIFSSRTLQKADSATSTIVVIYHWFMDLKVAL